MGNEFKILWGYVRAVFGYWWVITIELILVLLDLAERVFGTWLLPPLWAKVTMRIGRQFLYRHRPSSRSEADWVKWASDVDDWMSNTFVIIQTEFGDLAVEKFVNDAGMMDSSYPGVPIEFQQRMRVLNRRLQNLDAIAQRIDAYL